MTVRPRDTVLVISSPDPTSEAVVSELSRLPVHTVQLDIGEFPASARLAAHTTPSGDWLGVLETERTRIDLARVRSVYYRRPSRFTFAVGLSGSDAVLAEIVPRLGLGGVLAALDCPWLCDPVRVARAEYKPLQLAVLCRVGLSVPATLITNDHARAVEWARELGREIVCKQLSPIALESEGQIHIAYTTPVDLDEIAPAALATTAHCLQERIVDKHFEVRVTMVGDQAFAVAIHADSDAARLDWRRDYDRLRYEVFDPPPDLVAGLRRYLRAMDLSYGCFDLVATSDGLVVYECNPAGQYLWLEHATGLPISAAIAAHLVGAAA